MNASPSPAPARSVRFPLLGLDVSETKIGIAIVEHADATPQPLFTYLRETRARDLARCGEWALRYGIGGIVLGLPLNMDGTAGARAVWMTRFGRELRRMTGIPVYLRDERLSTVEAEERLAARGVRRHERAEQVDAMAAALILEWFMHDDELNTDDHA